MNTTQALLQEARTISEDFLQEFRKSAIPEWYASIAFEEWRQKFLTEALTWNVQTARNGSSQRVEYATRKDAQRIAYWDKFTQNGGWVARQATLSGVEPVPYIKLRTPRTDRDGKIVKYETPAKAEAVPLLTPHTWGMGLAVMRKHCPKRVQTAYRKRFKASGAALDSIDDGFWDFVMGNPSVPIVITEGWKKGCVLAVRGFPSIVLRGIRCFFRKRLKKGSDIVIAHEVNDRLFVKGRRATICFDEDEKEKTRKNVASATRTIAKWLQKRGSVVSIAEWKPELGKGVDDVLFAQGENADNWLTETIGKAQSYRAWKRSACVQKALEAIQRLNTLSCPVEQATEGEYLPQLPPLVQGAIHVLTASMNSGKTYRISRDWVRPTTEAINRKERVLVLAPLNSLGQQTAVDMGLPHIHDYGTDRDSQTVLWTDVRSRRGGLVMCPDSLHRIPQWFFEQDGKPCPILLVLDECNQVIKHLISGNTLGSRWAEINSRFAAIVTHALKYGSVIASEDGIPDRAIEFLQKVATAGEENPRHIPVRVFTHQKQAEPWDVTFYKGAVAGFRRELLNAIAKETPTLFVTSSQAEGERLERVIRAPYPHKKVHRIDSKTNEAGAYRDFFENPDQWLQEEKPDVLILSPSAKTGVSIEGGKPIEEAYFGSVWGYFPSLATDDQMQLLGRYRPPAPRHICVPEYIQASADEQIRSSRAVTVRLKANAEVLGRMIDLPDGDVERTAREMELEAAVLKYMSEELTVSGAQKSIARIALAVRLEQKGHQISEVQARSDGEIAEQWKKVQDEIWQDEAEFAAGLRVDPSVHTPKWARDTLNKMEVTRETRTRAHKVLWRDEFPGVTFDDQQECYEAVYRDYGRMKKGVKMQALAESPVKAKAVDAEVIASILKGNIRAFHRLPKSALQATLLAHLGVLDLLDGESYSNTDPRALAVKERALKLGDEIWYWLKLGVNEDQTPVEICNKLLRRFGLEIDRKDRLGAIEVVGRPGKRGDSRDRIYRINLGFNPTRTRLLEAYRRKLSEASYEPVSTVPNSSSTYIETKDPNPQKPPDKDIEGVAAMLVQFSSEGILDREAMLQLTSHLSQAEKRQVWGPLSAETRSKLKAIA